MDSSNETSYSLARKLGCSSSYIRKIMFRSRHVSDVKKPVGRPKTLDAESMAILQEASSNRYINMISQVLSVFHLSSNNTYWQPPVTTHSQRNCWYTHYHTFYHTFWHFIILFCNTLLSTDLITLYWTHSVIQFLMNFPTTHRLIHYIPSRNHFSQQTWYVCK